MALLQTEKVTTAQAATTSSRNYLFPFILVTSLFFLWGLAYGLLDVLNKHFQDALNVTKTRSTLLQGAYFGAYFLVALPAGIFMNRFGYKGGIILGLLLYATGAFLFFPSAQAQSFNFFLLSLFILASGLTFLETAANPYVTVLGKPETSAFRLNLSQSFNGVGSFVGPIIGAQLFFSENTTTGSDLQSVQYVYIIIGVVVLLIAGLFWRTSLPEIREEQEVNENYAVAKKLFNYFHFKAAIVTQFFYVAAQVGVAALFINYCTEAGVQITAANAAYLLSVSMILFTLGRFTGTALMRKIEAHRLLTLYALVNVALCAIVVWGQSWISVYSLMAIFFFESIMFPTIFALGIKGLGRHTQKASSFIIMAIVGGALVPYLMGLLSEKGTANAYMIPLVCFLVVAWFGWKGHRLKTADTR